MRPEEFLAVDLLMRVPALTGASGLNGLLTHLPRPLVSSLNRDPSNRWNDITLVLDQLSNAGRLAGGVWPLLVVLDAAQQSSRGLELEAEISELARRLEAAYGRRDIAPRFDPPETRPSSTEEALVFRIDRRVDLAFIEGALRTAAAVARIEVPLEAGSAYGTGWLFGPDHLITNWHVIDAQRSASDAELRASAKRSIAWFDYRVEGGDRYELQVTELVHYSRKLDYAVLALPSESTLRRTPLSIGTRAPLSYGSRLNIVQHPRGGPVRLAIRGNYCTDVETNLGHVRYVTDTEPGSSGSPVCDDSWAVRALHTRSTPVPAREFPEGIADFLNEGVAIERVIADLPAPLLALTRGSHAT